MRRSVAALAIVGFVASISLYLLGAPAKGSTFFQSMTQDDLEFLKFISKHGRNYATKEEFELRAANFKQSLKIIREINADPEETHTAGITKFADLSEQEFISSYTGRLENDAFETTNEEEVAESFQLDSSYPNSLDWRNSGVVSPI